MAQYTMPASQYITGYSATTAVTSTLAAFVSPGVILSSYHQVQTKTIGDAEFPAYELRSKYGKLSSPVYIPDTLRVWVECPSCTPVVSSAFAPEAAKSLGGIRPYSLIAATWQLAFGVQASKLDGPLDGAKVIGYDWTGSAGPATESEGFVVLTPGIGENLQPDFGYLDWKPFSIVKLKATIAPTPLRQAPGVPLAMNVVTSGSLPAHVTYRWDFGDGPPVVSVSDNPNTQHPYAAVGNYPVVVDILDAATQQPIARATATAKISVPRPVWRVTSFVLQSSQGPTPDPLLDDAQRFRDDLAPLLVTPDHGLIFLLDQNYQGPAPVVFQSYFPIVHLQVALPFVTDLQLDDLGFFAYGGFELAQICTGPLSGGCDINTLTVSGDLHAGTLGGTSLGTFGGFPPVETVTFQFNSTKNGQLLTGTIKMTDLLHTIQGNITGTRLDVWSFSATLEP
jgi:hypothetical protein